MSKIKRVASRTTKKGMLDKYNAREAKGNLGNTALKSGTDVVTGAIVGTGVGALAGKWAILIGPALIITGHYAGDKSGLLRIAGAASMAYGIACALENKTISGTVDGITLAGETSKVKARMENWKEQLKVAFFLDKIFKKGDDVDDAVSKASVGSIDLSALDMFEDFNQQEADEYEAIRGYAEDQQQLPDFTVNLPTSGQSDMYFAIIDEPDMTDF